MSDAALALAASVVMHVAWNLLARHQPRHAYPLWWVLLGHLLLLGPWGVYALLRDIDWNAQFAGLLFVSATANVVYFLGLRKAYEHAPVALVYPLVRSSPLLIALWSTAFLGESLAWNTWAGIVVTVVGLVILAAGGKNGDHRRAHPWALAAMFATSVYSLSDKAATAHIDTFGGLVGFVTVVYFVSWLALTVMLRAETGAWMPARRIRTSLFVIGGLCIGLAYGLVIFAMRALPAAEVVAYTNAGIAVASLLSIWLFKERENWRPRLAGAATICLGLVLMSVIKR